MRKPIPEYTKEMAEEAVLRLNNLKNENTVSFAFATDIHNCIDYAEREMYAVEQINKQHPLLFNCFGGDYLCNNSSTTKQTAVEQHKAFRAAIDGAAGDVPTIVVKGNHDDNPFGEISNIVPRDELYDLLLSRNSVFHGDEKQPKAAYGYYDIPEEKIRVIYLDSVDNTYVTDENGTVTDYSFMMIFGARQLTWLAEEALRLPENGWSVIVLSHIMPIATPLMHDRPFGGEAVWEILCAFKRGGLYKAHVEREGMVFDADCDFSAQGKGDIIAVITGHEHCDRTCMADGIRVITAASAASDNFGTGMCDCGRIQYKTRGSAEESAFSVFVADRKARKISLIRVGCGQDYTVNY